MGTIDKRVGANGTKYRARVCVHRNIRSKTFSKKTDAKNWIAEVRSGINHGQYIPTSTELRRTIADAIDKYLIEVLPAKKNNKDQVNPKIRLNWWRGELVPYRLVDVTPEVLLKCREKLRKDRAPATVNRHLAALSVVYQTAKRQWNWITHNPVRDVENLAVNNARDSHLSEEELDRLLKACQESPAASYLYPIVTLAVSLGMRPSHKLV